MVKFTLPLWRGQKVMVLSCDYDYAKYHLLIQDEHRWSYFPLFIFAEWPFQPA